MLIDIPWQEMPQTFRDVIEFVYALDIRYLWIDSYCIVQGYSSNWEAESKQMGKVFQNSYITIAATAAHHNDTGCFWDDDTSYERSIKIQGSSSLDVQAVRIRKAVQHWEMNWNENQVNRFPLLTRA